MKISTITYNIRQGFKNIWRNKMFSIASIATMAACIFLLGIFYSIGTNFKTIVKEAEESVSVTVFFNEDQTDDQIKAIGEKIKKRPEVDRMEYISAEEAWKQYTKEMFKGNEEAAASFADDNPLAKSSNYQIYLKDVSKQDAFVKAVQKIDGVREVNQSRVAAKTLTDFNRLMTLISVGVIAILIAVAVFLISNTVTVGISVRKDEIAIMKLIGAKDSFVRAPFVVEGVVIGLVGSIIPLVILWFLYSSILRYVATKFTFLSNLVTFVPIGDVFHTLLPLSLVLGVGIGYAGSRFTLKRHLKV
ncbi:MAG TPA: ABC transporter permease [Lachnospiraceae bacterium]|jgi:cell division transport system permease protein|nr:permease-like cell division protein FtsX [Lachnospiraceae bacterium]MDD6148587.1 permease-like cell division protein FtsX [Lachnospiraceae bacterium]MDY5703556.1 permease-like cell division protein FtsX [Lachnospiraceae bacterium]MEE3357303.1 permease-like cell division protein FtsX [Lachnospiraceae bacterium]HAN50311.1 ABC transporter permease [Lachnospiraceae bacterium]